MYNIGYHDRGDNCPAHSYFARPVCTDYFNYIYQFLELDISQMTMIPCDQVGTLLQKGHLDTRPDHQNGTLLGGMASGKLETVLRLLVATEVRLAHLSFASPYRFNRICMFARRPTLYTLNDSPWYFVQGFTPVMWLAILSTVVVLVILYYVSLSLVGANDNREMAFDHHPSNCRNPVFVSRMFRFIRGYQLHMMPMTCGLMCYLYSSSMRANFMKAEKFVPPFNGIKDAIHKIYTGERSLVVRTTDDYILEIVNNSTSVQHDTDFSLLRKALQRNPFLIASKPKECALSFENLEQNSFFLESETWIAKLCNFAQIQASYSTCIDGTMMSGLMFRRNSRLTEKASRSVQFFKIYDRHTNQEHMATLKQKMLSLTQIPENHRHRTSTPVLALKTNCGAIFGFLCFGLGISLMYFIRELRMTCQILTMYNIGYIHEIYPADTFFVSGCKHYYRNLYQHIGLKNRQLNFISYDQMDTRTNHYNDTLLGDMASGKLDTAFITFAATEDRITHLSFASPFIYDRLCIFGRPALNTLNDSPWYFVQGFTLGVWIAILSTIVVLVILHYLSFTLVGADDNRRMTFDHDLSNWRKPVFVSRMFRFIRRNQLHLMPMTCGLICHLYSSSMCANFIKTEKFVPPFSGIRDAIRKISTGERSLTVRTRDNFVFEIVNNSQSVHHDTEFALLHKALHHNPVMVAPRPEKCAISLKNLGQNSFFLETENNVAYRCKFAQITSSYSTCMDFTIMVGLMFRRGSKLTEKASRSAPFFKMHDRKANNESVLRRKQKMLSQTRIQENHRHRRSTPVLTFKSNCGAIFGILCFGLGTSLMCFMGERLKHPVQVFPLDE